MISDTTAGSGDGDRTVKADFLQLAASPDAVRQARRLVRTRPAEWGLEALIDDRALVVSELATNAVKAEGEVIAGQG